MLQLKVISDQAQEALGGALARLCPRPAVIWLEGDLGAGKTTLARGFLRGLGHQGAVKSPTYTLVEPYPEQGCHHFDLYRLADPEELEYIGIRDLLDGDSLLLVEWPERGEGVLPVADLLVRIEYLEQGRRVSLDARTDAFKRVLEQLRGLLPENVEIY